MVRVLAIASLVAAFTATARAQAPGEIAPGAPPPPPQFVAQGPAPIDVMANRWAIGLSVGGLTLAPHSAPDQKTHFGLGELSLRFRVTPHLELEGAFGGGREQLKDGSQGDAQASTALLAARYRFRPERAWNGWLMGGLGAVSIAPHDATDQMVQDAQRPIAELGIGIERRFAHLALQAELTAVGVGQPKPAQQVPTKGTAVQTMPPAPAPTPATDDKLSGASFTIGASYYF